MDGLVGRPRPPLHIFRMSIYNIRGDLDVRSWPSPLYLERGKLWFLCTAICICGKSLHMFSLAAHFSRVTLPDATIAI